MLVLLGCFSTKVRCVDWLGRLRAGWAFLVLWQRQNLGWGFAASGVHLAPGGRGCCPFWGGGFVVVDFLFVVATIVGVCGCSVFFCALLCVCSGDAVVLMEWGLVALLCLSSWGHVVVGWLFLVVPWGCLWFVIVVFSDHTH